MGLIVGLGLVWVLIMVIVAEIVVELRRGRENRPTEWSRQVRTLSRRNYCNRHRTYHSHGSSTEGGDAHN